MSNEKTIIDVITLDEIEQLEQLTGKDVNELFAGGKFSGRALKSLVWILQKRTNPDAKIENSGSLTFTDATNFVTEFLKDPKAPN
jgi:hypothetical protein